MTAFEDRVRRIVRETMEELDRDPDEIGDVVAPPGAEYCLIRFRDDSLEPIEVSEGIGAGESQEKDEVVRALRYRLRIP
ncbi:MAG: hypothetical protein KY432_07830 [Acidobacteria bacterium]|nr:hypothetical protein [Acidobacteriota bacterium]